MTDSTHSHSRAAAAHRRRRWLWAGAPILLLVVLVTLGEIVGWPFLRGPLQTLLSDAAKVPVRLDGDFHARFVWQPHLQVGHLQVAPAAGVQAPVQAPIQANAKQTDAEKVVEAPHLLDAKDFDLAWRWLDIWRWWRGGPLRIERLHAADVDARLLRDKSGHATWQIGAAKPPAKDAEAPGTTLPQFGSLRVAKGTVIYDDAVLDSELRVRIDGGEGSADAGYRASVKGRWEKLPLDLKIDSGAVLPLLADKQAGDAGPALNFSVKGAAGAARISFEGRAAAVFGAQNLDGKLAFSGPSLARVGEPLGLTLPATPPFDLQGELSRQDGIWHLKAEHFSIGTSRLQGDFRFDPGQQPPLLSGQLGGQRLALADLGPSVGAPEPGASADSAARKGRVLPDKRFDLPSLRAMDADVQVAIDELDFGTPKLAPLQRVKTHLTLKGAVLKLDALSAVVAGGDFDGSTQLDAREPEARWALDAHFGTVDVAAWLRGLQTGGAASAAAKSPAAEDTAAIVADRNAAKRGGDQAPQSYLTGALTGHLKVNGRGNSTAEILGRIDGNATLLLRDGTVSHLVTEGADLDIAQALGVLIKGDTALPLRCARLDLKADSGRVQIERAVLDNRDSTIRVAGQVNLQNEELALKAASKAKDFSPFSLNTPVVVGGTLGNPAIGIESKKLGLKVLGAAVLAAVFAPAAALLPFVEFPSDGEKGDLCADRDPAQSAAPASSSKR